MGMRALLVSMMALVLIRIVGRRSFGQRSAFDHVVAILPGATLSRAIVGASPLVATIVASTMISCSADCWPGSACIAARWNGWWMPKTEVFRDGQFNQAKVARAFVPAADIEESVRQTLGARGMSGVEAAVLERNGAISVIRKDEVGSSRCSPRGRAEPIRSGASRLCAEVPPSSHWSPTAEPDLPNASVDASVPTIAPLNGAGPGS